MSSFFAPISATRTKVKQSTPWVEKYRPKTVDEVVHQEEVVRTLKKSLETGNLPHLLFYGPPGTGKTTTINGIARQLYGPEHFRTRMLELNASDERGISVVRDKVKNFSQLSVSARPAGSKYPMPPYKLVVLDEADSMTTDAQAALRRIMENFSKTTRFCLICNYVSRIIEPLASRCAKFRFRPLAASALESRLSFVATSEGFETSSDVLNALRQVSGGDMRKAITLLQSARALYGDDLSAQGVIELAGVVPEARVAALLAAVRGETSGGFAAVQAQCRALVADGYAAKRVLSQCGAALLAPDTVARDELAVARCVVLLADAEYALLGGADEYLQLLDALSGAHQLLTATPANSSNNNSSSDMQQ